MQIIGERSLAAKTAQLLSLLSRRPREFGDRVSTICQVFFEGFLAATPDYPLTDWQDLVMGVEIALQTELRPFTLEPEFAEIEASVNSGISKLIAHAPFRLSHNADFTLARLYYLICRALKPSCVLETGVGYGVSSAFILRAMEINAAGALYSIDLPPLGRNADDFVGFLIPESLRRRWHLHRGTSKRILPQLLRQIGQLDMFIHDSLHTNTNVRQELEAVTSHLAPCSIVIADDINENVAFHRWVRRMKPAFWAAIREETKPSIFGVCVMSGK